MRTQWAVDTDLLPEARSVYIERRSEGRALAQSVNFRCLQQSRPCFLRLRKQKLSEELDTVVVCF